MRLGIEPRGWRIGWFGEAAILVAAEQTDETWGRAVHVAVNGEHTDESCEGECERQSWLCWWWCEGEDEYRKSRGGAGLREERDAGRDGRSMEDDASGWVCFDEDAWEAAERADEVLLRGRMAGGDGRVGEDARDEGGAAPRGTLAAQAGMPSGPLPTQSSAWVSISRDEG